LSGKILLSSVKSNMQSIQRHVVQAAKAKYLMLRRNSSTTTPAHILILENVSMQGPLKDVKKFRTQNGPRDGAQINKKAGHILPNNSFFVGYKKVYRFINFPICQSYTYQTTGLLHTLLQEMNQPVHHQSANAGKHMKKKIPHDLRDAIPAHE
jgi:hypothetical protein